ncbi:MAG: Gfo/Idh/MocA family oxidoreductase [Clostridia bacterium]|nr:Gfo/Idh/MocA family oxidoreductase [Clostridia bacterium]
MRTAIIGASGHYPYAVRGASKRREQMEICAVAAGTKGEDLTGLISSCEEAGFRPAVYDDWRELLEEVKPDVCAVNPWFCDSAEISIYALERGIHVYSEKPLACDEGTLDRLYGAYQSSGAELAGMFDGRHTPWLRTVKDAVDRGEIGEIRLLHGRKSYKMGKRGPVYEKTATYGGMLGWIAIHPMSWFDYLLERDPEKAVGMTDASFNNGTGEMETAGTMLISYPGGVLASINADFFRPEAGLRHDDDRIMVTGTKGFIETKDGNVWLENDKPRRKLDLLPGEDPFLYFIDSIGTEKAKELAKTAFAVTRCAVRTQAACGRK